MSTFLPLKDFVLLQELPKDESTTSGIIIPETTDQEPPMQGKVIEVGELCKIVQKDDVVMFRRYGFEEIQIDKVSYLVGSENNIFGKLCL